MIAQDVGSAIRGPERGDIYFGSGEAAGRLAGVTKHPANFVVLLPNGRLISVPIAAAYSAAVASYDAIVSSPGEGSTMEGT